jgi:hypothetical protein
MRDINFSGSLGDFKDSIGMKPSKRIGPSIKSQRADMARKTLEAINIVKEDLGYYYEAKKDMLPGMTFSPQVEKRISEYQDFFADPNNRMAYKNPGKMYIKPAVPKKKK